MNDDRLFTVRPDDPCHLVVMAIRTVPIGDSRDGCHDPSEQGNPKNRR
jgi:hypothetical protein